MIKLYKSVSLLLLISHGIVCDVTQHDEDGKHAREQKEKKTFGNQERIIAAVGVSMLAAALAVKVIAERNYLPTPSGEEEHKQPIATPPAQPVDLSQIRLLSPAEQHRIVYTLLKNDLPRDGMGKASMEAELQTLIAHGIDIDAHDAKGNSPLKKLAFRGNIQGVRTLIAKRSDPFSSCFAKGTTLLEESSSHLLYLSASHATIRNINYVISILGEYTDNYCLQKIEEVDAINHLELSALPREVTKIVQGYALPDLNSAFMRHALNMIGEPREDFKKITRDHRLLPTIVTMTDSHGQTLLHHAVETHFGTLQEAEQILKTVKFLLTAKADPWRKNSDADTALDTLKKSVLSFQEPIQPFEQHLAFRNKTRETCTLLEQHMRLHRLDHIKKYGNAGLKPEQDTFCFFKALRGSTEEHKTTYQEYLQHAPDIVSYHDQHGFSAFDVISNKTRLMQQLLDAKASPNMKNNQGETPLHRIALLHMTKTTRLPNVDDKEEDGQSELQKFIVTCHPNPSVCDNNGKTARDHIATALPASRGQEFARGQVIMDFLRAYENQYNNRCM